MILLKPRFDEQHRFWTQCVAAIAIVVLKLDFGLEKNLVKLFGQWQWRRPKDRSRSPWGLASNHTPLLVQILQGIATDAFFSQKTFGAPPTMDQGCSRIGLARLEPKRIVVIHILGLNSGQWKWWQALRFLSSKLNLSQPYSASGWQVGSCSLG